MCGKRGQVPDMALFKILRAPEWAAFEADGVFDGSADDLRDGFIHLSADEQLAGTLARHFAGEAGLLVLRVAVEADPMLRWEPSRGGALFPHLYRPVARADVVEVRRPG
jgi:uncharacterized protein (DUF952 family)